MNVRRMFSVGRPHKQLQIVYNLSFFLATRTDSECSTEEEMTKCIRSVCTRFAVATASNRYPT